MSINQNVAGSAKSTADGAQWDRLFRFLNNGTQRQKEHDWSYLELDVWPIVKAQVLMRASNIYNAGRPMHVKGAPSNDSPRGFSLQRLFGLKSRPKYQASDFLDGFEWPDITEYLAEDTVLCLGYSTNHKKIGSTYFQLCMDPLRAALALNGYHTTGFITGFPAHDEAVQNAAVKDLTSIERQFRDVRRLAKKLPPLDLDDLPGFSAWWADIHRMMGDDIFITKEHIEGVIKETAICAFWFFSQFKRRRPKAVVVSAYYGLAGHGASWACRRLGIPIADVQHGVAGVRHHAYSWPNAPERGFNTLPTAFFCWSENEVRELQTGSGKWRPGLLQIGNVWRLLDQTILTGTAPGIYKEGGIEAAHQALCEETAAIERIKQSIGGEVDILIALHPGEQIDWFDELRAHAPKTWRFWIRLHPGELKSRSALEERLAEVSGPRTFVIEPSTSSLSTILKEVDVVATKYSSVVLDAYAFGVQSIAYSEAAARHFFGASWDDKLIYVNPTAKDIETAISACLSARAGVSTPEVKPLNVLGQEIAACLSLNGVGRLT
ncbi:hypothetical protein [Microvirga makkahensis]|uniref:Capsule polysaccharide biosynthesis protein n=1 Tax=Microvirga makkahensis TaxID=1128670 RepID=A0A7X3MTC9_9HYPH|nr:hypothetical protein [Microvirga makkahensis]MXQ12896.1 hypothetical protein [Microvirga makkahensis]